MMVLGNLPVPGRPTIWMIVGQELIALAVVRVGLLGYFYSPLFYLFSPLSPSLWEAVRYRLKYCLKGPLKPKQPTNLIPSFKVVSMRMVRLPLMQGAGPRSAVGSASDS